MLLAGGDENDGNVGSLLAKAVGHGKAPSNRHHNVQENQVGFAFHGQPEAVHPIRCGQNLIARGLQANLESLHDLGVIINDENLLFHVAC